MSEGDELLALIQQAVKANNVPPAYQAMVTEIVARTCIRVMTDPRFLNRLNVVLDLQEQNRQLRNMLAAATASVRRPAPRKTPPKKKAPARKRAAKSPPSVRVKGSTPPNRTAFREGFEGR